MVRLSYRDDIAPLLTLGLPLVGSAVASFLIHMTDTIMLGWYDVALAASVLANSLWFLIFIMGAGFGFAVMPIVAAASASGDDTRARRTTRMAFWLSLIFFAVSFPLNWWSGAVFGLMGQEPDLAEAGQGYLRITAWAMAPALLMAVLRSYLSALKLTTILLVVTLVGVVLNAIINYALIFGNWGFPELGLTGAALATVIGNLVALLVLAIYAQVKRPDYNLYQRLWKPDWEAFHQVRRIGLPIGLATGRKRPVQRQYDHGGLDW
jgi:MATE family multidrug resistance protein